MAKSKADGHAEITKRIQSLNDQFLDCRDPGLRHAWMREKDFHVIEQAVEAGSKGKVVYLQRVEVCGRCNCYKYERFQVTGSGIEKVSQKYEYPEGYLMPGIPRGVKPSTIIYQENYRRAMEKVAKAQPGQRERSGNK